MTTSYRIENGDISINPVNGHPDMLIDILKTKQDVREMLLIETQTDNGFGAGLINMIGELPEDDLSPSSINFDFSMRVRGAVQRMIRLQQVFQFGQRTQLEVIDKILFLRAEPSREDPTMYRFLVRLQVLAGALVSMGGSLSA